MKKTMKTKQTTSAPVLRTQTLQQLENSKLPGVFGGGRLWVPGFPGDTTPLYEEDFG